MGIYIGNVSKFQENKGHITLTLNNKVSIGDTITFEKENTKYTISELMQNNQNLAIASAGQKVTIGRMKGNIRPGDKIYRLTNKELTDQVKNHLQIENKKYPLSAMLDVAFGKPINLTVFNSEYQVTVTSSEIPEIAVNHSITKERLEQQLNKLTDTPFYFETIEIHLDDNLFIPHIASINELRRSAIEKITRLICNQYKRETKELSPTSLSIQENSSIHHKICLLLNKLYTEFNYTKLNSVDKLYIPLRYFVLKEYEDTLSYLTKHFSTYIYLPNIMKQNYKNLLMEKIDTAIEKYIIRGFVLSNVGNLEMLENYSKDYEMIGNYTLNVFNNYNITAYGLNIITISPELNKEEINEMASKSKIATEFIVYGNLPLMTSSYCLLGKSNRCYPECEQKCKSSHTYYLKDRMNFLFRIIPDNMQTITTIYNSKITSIAPTEIEKVNNYRIDILDESIEEINEIIKTVKERNRLEGNHYTNGNFNRIV